MRRLGSVSICLMAMFGLSPARADLVDFIVNAGANLAAFIGQPIIFAGSAADPDNGIASVQWDFNYDGSNFDADPSANGTLMPLHTYGAPGTYQVALDATDNGGVSEIVHAHRDCHPGAKFCGGSRTEPKRVGGRPNPVRGLCGRSELWHLQHPMGF